MPSTERTPGADPVAAPVTQGVARQRGWERDTIFAGAELKATRRTARGAAPTPRGHARVGPSARNADRTVFRATLDRRAISLIGTPSARW